jgi:hypothetical protein
MTDEPDRRLDRLAAPPPGRDFHSELWERIDARERAARRRRRVLVTVAAAAALVTVSAAGVFAYGAQSKPLDRTLSCPVPEQGGVNVLHLTAHVKAPPMIFGGTKPVPSPAVALVIAGDPTTTQVQYVGVTSVRNGYLFDQSVCHTAPTIPLARAGLPPAGVFTGTKGAGIDRECWLATTISVRLHVTLGRSGAPVAAQLAIRSGTKLRPVAYIVWAPTRIRAFVAPSCQLR